MTSEEMQKAIRFIVEMQRQTTIKLNRLGIKINAIPVLQNRSEKRWKRTEERIRALLTKAKIRERGIAAQKRSIPASGGVATRSRRKTATDRRLRDLAKLVERQINEHNSRP